MLDQPAALPWDRLFLTPSIDPDEPVRVPHCQLRHIHERAGRRCGEVRNPADAVLRHAIKHRDRLSDDLEAREFWGFVVYNFGDECVQVCLIVQATIKKALRSLVDNPKWGSPVENEYDVAIHREGKGFGTTYTVTPSPGEPIDEEFVRQAKSVNLDALFDGSD